MEKSGKSADRRAKKAAAMQLFAKQIGRQAQKGVEPNDRKHDIAVERTLRRMPPEEFDRLLREGEDEPDAG